MNLPDWAGYRRFRDRFAEAMDPAFHPIEYLDGLILSGEARLFVGEHAAIVAEIKAFPGGARVGWRGRSARRGQFHQLPA